MKITIEISEPSEAVDHIAYCLQSFGTEIKSYKAYREAIRSSVYQNGTEVYDLSDEAIEEAWEIVNKYHK